MLALAAIKPIAGKVLAGVWRVLGWRGAIALVLLGVVLLRGCQVERLNATAIEQEAAIGQMTKWRDEARKEATAHRVAGAETTRNGMKWRALADERESALATCNAVNEKITADKANAELRARESANRLAAADKATRSKRYTPQCVAAQVQVGKLCPSVY